MQWNKHAAFAAVTLAGAVVGARAESISVKADHCAVTFDVAAELHPATEDAQPGYLYRATGGRTNVSLYVAKPWCTGDTSAAAAAACLQRNVASMPGMVKASYSVEARPSGAQAAYVQYVRMGDNAIKVMHTHVLFKCGDQWGDLHMSTVKPTVDEIAGLLALGDHLKVSE